MDKILVQNLIVKCENLLENSKKEQDNRKIKIYNSIHEILNNENCFDKIDAEIAMNILLDLGFSSDEVVSVYSQLIAK